MNRLNIFTNSCQRLSPTRVRYIFRRNNLGNNFSLDSFNVDTLKNASFNVYLSNIKIYKSLYLYLNIMIIYANNTYKRRLIKENISAKNSNSYLNVNLDNLLTPVDVKNFKTIIIDIYSKNIFLYFASHSISKAPFINLEFYSFKNFYNHPAYSNYNKYSFNDLLNLTSAKSKNKYISAPNTKSKNKYINAPNNNILHKNNIHNDNYIIPKDNGTEKRNLKYRTLEELIHKYEHGTSCSLLIKLINKYIKVKVEFNGTKILQGILDKVTPDTILLKDGNYNHVIRIDSISIIHTSEDINLNDLVSNDPSSYILKSLKYLKNKDIKLEINDADLNISTVKIINYCNSFVQVEDINSKKTYFFNSDHIKTVEYIPITKEIQ